MSRISEFNPRRNNFDVLRLVLAAMVAVSHGIVISTGSQLMIGSVTLGDLAVDSFFVLSGFLVARSYLRLDNPLRFAWNRFLRIMPGFWVCLLAVALVAAPVAALLEGRDAITPFVAEPSAWSFLIGNAALLIRQYDIAGLLAGNPTPLVFVGSLWTLALEAVCYGLLGALGLLNALRHRGVVLGLTLVVWGLFVVQEFGVAVPLGDNVLRFALLFLLGACAHLYGHRIPLRSDLACAATVALAATVLLVDNYRVIAAPALVYALLWVAMGTAWHAPIGADFSYGLFMYHYPVQQLLVLTLLGSAPTMVFVVVSVAFSFIPAVVSWYVVERRALSWKNAHFPSWLPVTGRSSAIRQEPR
ncbi:MAG: acyltransferase [Candidatus Phosphoribacter sp.]